MHKIRLGKGKQVVISVGGKTYIIRDGVIIEDDSEVEVIRKFVEGAGGEFVLVEEKPKHKATRKKKK